MPIQSKNNTNQISDLYIAKKMQISEKELLALYPPAYIETQRLAIKIKMYCNAFLQGETNEIEQAKDNLPTELPKAFVRPSNLAELKDSLYGVYYQLVKGNITLVTANMELNVSNMILRGNQLRQENQIKSGGEPLELN